MHVISPNTPKALSASREIGRVLGGVLRGEQHLAPRLPGTHHAAGSALALLTSLLPSLLNAGLLPVRPATF